MGFEPVIPAIKRCRPTCWTARLPGSACSISARYDSCTVTHLHGNSPHYLSNMKQLPVSVQHAQLHYFTAIRKISNIHKQSEQCQRHRIYDANQYLLVKHNCLLGNGEESVTYMLRLRIKYLPAVEGLKKTKFYNCNY